MEPNPEKQPLPTGDYQPNTSPPPPYPAATAYAYPSPQGAPPIYQPPGMNPYPEKAPGGPHAPPFGGVGQPSNVTVYPPGSASYTPGQGSVIVTQPGTQVVLTQQQQRPPATGAIVLSCCVLCCCCWPLGLAAFVFAVMATSASDYNNALKKLQYSKWLSIAGLVIGSFLTAFLIFYEVKKVQRQNEYDYDY